MANQAHPALNQEEYIIAGIGGTGVLLMMVAGMVNAFGTTEEILGLGLTQIALIGLVLVAIAAVLWLALLRPWQDFDDLTTPYYTGHDHDHHDQHDAAEDLELIEGIGAKIKELLAAKHITSFKQLAASHADDLQGILKAEGIHTADPSTWAKQAQFIVDGDVQGFEAYKEQVVRGQAIDDLTIIEGIGPKVKEALLAAGINTFKQIATAQAEDLVRIVKEEAGVRMVGDAATWAKQAQFIVDGDIPGLKAYQEKLVGGREPEA